MNIVIIIQIVGIILGLIGVVRCNYLAKKLDKSAWDITLGEFLD